MTYLHMVALAFVLALGAAAVTADDMPEGTYLQVDPDDLYVVTDPIDPPPIDPCDENPEASGCPCPDDPGHTYPNCPVDPPIDPNEPVPPPTGDIKSCADVEGPCVEYHMGDDWKSKMQAVPTSGGTMLVMPGNHYITNTPYLASRAYINIIGVLSGENMDRPKVTASVPMNAFVPWGGTNGDLTVQDIWFDSAGNCIYSGSKIRQQTITLTNVKLTNCGHGLMGAFEYEKSSPETAVFDDVYYLNNVECAYSGTHCIYIDRSLRAELKGGRYWSAGFHPIKIVSKIVLIDGVEASNGELDGTVGPSGKVGAAIMSLVGCQWGEVKNSKLTFVYRPEAGGNFITRQPRHDIKGCDTPPYTGTEFWTEEYWQDPDNFNMAIHDNEFKVTGDDRWEGTVLNFVLLNPTAPVEAVSPGSTKLKYIARPEWWIERSQTAVYENIIQGMNPQDNLCLTRPWGNMVEGNEPPFVEMCVLPGQSRGQAACIDLEEWARTKRYVLKECY